MRKLLTRLTQGGVPYRYVLPATVGVLCTLVPTASVLAGSTTYETEETRTATIRAETRIFVKNARGKTIIVGRKDSDEVIVRARKYVRAKDSDTATEWMEQLDFTVNTDGEQISVITHHPERSGEGGSFWAFLMGIRHRAYIDYTIDVPGDFGAKVASTSGDVQITSLGGNVKLFGSSGDVYLNRIGGSTFVEISSGDVDIKEIGGNLHIRMSSGDAMVHEVGGNVGIQGTSGDVEAYEVTGDAKIELASGSVILKGCGGDAILKTVSGDGRIARVGGNVKAVAKSGDVVASLKPLGANEYVLRTSSGDVEVTFEATEGHGFVLEVSTSSGSIEGELDVELDRISRRMLTGVVGSGDGRLYIETANGDIRIREIGK
ncbi:MAG: DUF4097 family beta strand repeat protein [Candidatus Latescibacterota bacterium]|nr:MAG: DUF4097 family beta strand repeat protein [Candidatus Latescibacterota bacterium]